MADHTQPVAELLFKPADNVPISTEESSLKPWADARDNLAASPKYWLATTRSTGRPHVMPVLAVWLDDSMYISTRPGTRKAKNLTQNDQCVVTVSTETVDLVVESTATEVTDHADNERVADAFYAKYQWRLTVRDSGVYEDSLPGSPEYRFYKLTPTMAFGYGPDGRTATRWRF